MARYIDEMRFAMLAVVGAACSSGIGDQPHATSTQEAPPIDARVEVSSPAPVAPKQRLPELATPLAYDLRLEVDPDREAFRGKVEIRVQLARATGHIWLHADALVIEKASYRAGSKTGTLVDLSIPNDDDMRGFGFGAAVTGEVVLAFEYTGKVIKDEPEGLFRQQAGGKWYLYAQSESVFARRILPCFDEPRWKPSWKVTLVVPEKLVALGNGGVIKETRAAGKRTVELAEITRMPSYLLSIAVGPFAVVEVGKLGRNKVPTRVVVPAGNAGKVGVVPLKLPSVIEALESYLDRPLPLAKLDLVAIPSFFGAMENTGLITFEASMLIGDPKQWWVSKRFVRFAAHELAHQWFGNQVTQTWWDDLWLAEGFSTWLGDRTSDQLGAYADPSMRRQLARLHALESDDEATPRPLRRAIDSDGVEDRFDAIAYEKGGALLDMIEEFVGNDAFQKAIRGYVAAHDGGSVTSKDVVAALSTISGDAAAVMTTYLDLGGAPVVTLALDCSGKPTLTARVEAGTVPVCVRHPGGRACVAASSTKGTFELPSCPAWVIGNAGGDGYYRIADPALAAQAPTTPSELLTYADDLAAALLRGDVALPVVLAEVARLARGKDSASVLGAAMIAASIDPLVEEAERAAWTRWLTTRFGARLKVSIPPTGVDSTLREKTWELLAKAPGKAWFDKIVARAKQAPEAKQRRILENLGELSPELAVPIVELAFGTFKPERVLPAIATMLARPSARSAMWRALRERLPKLIAAVAAVELEDLVAATGSLCDPRSRAEVVAAFTGRLPSNMLPKPLAAIDRCIARRSKLVDLRLELPKIP